MIKSTGQKIDNDYNESLSTILSEINVRAPWTHDEFIGGCFMVHVKPTWQRSSVDGKVAYHLTATKNKYVDDAIIVVDYDRECHVTLIAPPRPILGYVTVTDYISMFPLYDGTTVKAYFFDDKWCLASRNGACINASKLFSESFEDIFHRLVDVDSLDQSHVYVISLTSRENCPYADTIERGVVIEDISVDGNVITTSIIDSVNPAAFSKDSIDGGLLGFVYRTADGIYIDRSDLYADINRVIYDVPKRVIDRLSAVNDDRGFVRRIFIITRAILKGWDVDFSVMYPSYTTDYISVRDFINAIARHIFTMCCTRTRNPDMLGNFAYLMAEQIGPLRTKDGKNIVADALYNGKYAEAIAYDYLKSCSK